MSRRYRLTGRTGFGKSVSHSHRRTNRRWGTTNAGAAGERI
jgi:ribosomal protein L28